MGRKGVSKRKPKKSGPFSGVKPTGPAGEGSPVQTLVKDRGTPFNQGGKPRSNNISKKR